jgi:hypothetical protein
MIIQEIFYCYLHGCKRCEKSSTRQLGRFGFVSLRMLMGFDWGIERSFIEKLSTRDLDCKQREKRCDEMKKNNIYIYIYIHTHVGHL